MTDVPKTTLTDGSPVTADHRERARNAPPEGRADMSKSCWNCKSLYKDSEDPFEFPDLWWWACRKKVPAANLRSFPFKDTQCIAFEQKPLTPSDVEALRGVLSDALAEQSNGPKQAEQPK